MGGSTTSLTDVEPPTRLLLRLEAAAEVEEEFHYGELWAVDFVFWTCAPVANEAEFTRYLYRYRSVDEGGKPQALVLKNLNELAICFLPRDTARQWGYLR